ncbi:MAG: hypothetical protein ACQGVK_01585 [Myxococcota bacterium]
MNALSRLARRIARLLRGGSPSEAGRFAARLDRALADTPAALGLSTLERALAARPDGPAAVATDHEAGL